MEKPIVEPLRVNGAPLSVPVAVNSNPLGSDAKLTLMLSVPPFRGVLRFLDSLKPSNDKGEFGAEYGKIWFARQCTAGHPSHTSQSIDCTEVRGTTSQCSPMQELL
jgi:hypothetical protein